VSLVSNGGTVSFMSMRAIMAPGWAGLVPAVKQTYYFWASLTVP
jgi:hypothetical protein